MQGLDDEGEASEFLSTTDLWNVSPCRKGLESIRSTCPAAIGHRTKKENSMSLESHVQALREKHAQVDREVEDLERSPSSDDLEIRAAKRRKLALKDEIEQVSLQVH
jgi:hypothetical protein